MRRRGSQGSPIHCNAPLVVIERCTSSGVSFAMIARLALALSGSASSALPGARRAQVFYVFYVFYVFQRESVVLSSVFTSADSHSPTQE